MNPRLLITLGDVAGIGPEIVARAWPQLVRMARPVVVGDPGWVERGLRLSWFICQSPTRHQARGGRAVGVASSRACR